MKKGNDFSSGSGYEVLEDNLLASTSVDYAVVEKRFLKGLSEPDTEMVKLSSPNDLFLELRKMSCPWLWRKQPTVRTGSIAKIPDKTIGKIYELIYAFYILIRDIENDSADEECRLFIDELDVKFLMTIGNNDLQTITYLTLRHCANRVLQQDGSDIGVTIFEKLFIGISGSIDTEAFFFKNELNKIMKFGVSLLYFAFPDEDGRQCEELMKAAVLFVKEISTSYFILTNEKCGHEELIITQPQRVMLKDLLVYFLMCCESNLDESVYSSAFVLLHRILNNDTAAIKLPAKQAQGIFAHIFNPKERSISYAYIVLSWIQLCIEKLPEEENCLDYFSSAKVSGAQVQDVVLQCMRKLSRIDVLLELLENFEQPSSPFRRLLATQVSPTSDSTGMHGFGPLFNIRSAQSLLDEVAEMIRLSETSASSGYQRLHF